MTTQLNIDDAVLSAVQNLAAASGRSLDVVVSDLVRKGLELERPAGPARVEITVREGFAVGTLDPAVAPIDVAVVRHAVEDPDA
jgi:hypothetical protein